MEKQWKSEDELNDAVSALMYRIETLQAPSVRIDIQNNSPNIKVLESGFRNTVREVFGAQSPEFAEFGHIEMFQGPLRGGMPISEIIEARLRGREYFVMIAAELIGRLQQKIHQLRRAIDSKKRPSIDPDSLHPRIAEAAGELLKDGHFWEAVFAASKALVLHVKARSGREDLDGVSLMRTVFSKNGPILRFNGLDGQTALDHQEGMMHLFEGAVMALRNLGGHSFPNGPSEIALQHIQLLSLLARRADDAELV